MKDFGESLKRNFFNKKIYFEVFIGCIYDYMYVLA